MNKMNVCAILALVATVSFSPVSAQRHGQRQDRQRAERIESYVGQRVLPHEALRVKRELRLRQYEGAGKQIKSIAVVLNTRRRGVMATLKINQRVVSRPQYIQAQQRGVARFVLDRPISINQNLGAVQVTFDAPVMVEYVRAQIVDRRSGGQGQGRQRIKKDVYRFQAGFGETVSLKELMDLRQRQTERRVGKVKLTVRSLVGKSSISLCRANGRCISQKSFSSDSEQVIVLDPAKSPKLGRLSLQTTGMVFISKVVVVLDD